MGVKVSFAPAVVQVEAASQYEDVAGGWLRDADGDPATTGDQFANPPVEIDNVAGTVAMTGAHLAGPGSTGLNGKILLGWVDFRAVAVGSAALNIDLAKKHPNDPTDKFDNFVTAQGVVDEPTNIPGSLGSIDVAVPDADGDGVPDSSDNCVNVPNAAQTNSDADTVGDACDNCTLIDNEDQYDSNGDGYGNRCDGDLNDDGNTSFLDLGLFKASFGKNSTDPDWISAGYVHSDLDGNGMVSFLDLGIFKSLFNKPPGPSGTLP